MVVDEKIINHLVENNGFEYNIHKASEEFQELALVLNQKLLKPNKVNDSEIIDEIGDCIIRLEILKKLYNNELIQQRIDKKLSDYKNWIDHKRYKHI
jgi:hypothetical protein